MPAVDRTPLNQAALRADLVSQDGPWRELDVVDETGSTNADLLARAQAGADIAGAVLLAEYQTAGRGRHGRTWSAPPLSQISISVGVDAAQVAPEAWGWLPLLTGVAVVDAIRAVSGIEASLKWPNDVLAGGGKLAGILAEVAAPKPVIVVGLGLNVTLTEDALPDPNATSLLMLGATNVNRDDLVHAILRELGRRTDRWRSSAHPDEALAADYRQRSLTLGTQVKATLPGDKAIVGTAQAIDEQGRLIIDDGTTTTTVAAGDITHLRPSD